MCGWQRSGRGGVVILALKMVSQDNVPKRFQVPNLNQLILYEITLDQLQVAFHQGLLTSTDYAAFCLSRIQGVPLSMHRRRPALSPPD